MNNYLKILSQSPLFNNINPCELDSLLPCLNSKILSYKKNEFIYHIGENISSIGLVLSGSVHIIKEDFWGNQSILTKITVGHLFGETYACTQSQKLGVSIITTEPTEIIFLNVKCIMTTCSSTCKFHTRLIQNFLYVLAEKNLMLTKKIEHISQRNTRDKLLSYLSSESQRQKSSSFDIPFNRQQLADYLYVDRSAMSNELCKLRDEGILTFNKNTFQLK